MPDLVIRPGSALRARAESSVDYLSFSLGEDLYAVELRSVREIVVPPPMAIVPRAPKVVTGVCSVRGQLVTVLDLRTCLGLPRPELTPGRILLARTDDDELMGLLVDDVRQVVRLLPTEIELGTAALGSELSDMVAGIGRPRSGELLVILDLLAILARGRQ